MSGARPDRVKNQYHNWTVSNVRAKRLQQRRTQPLECLFLVPEECKAALTKDDNHTTTSKPISTSPTTEQALVTDADEVTTTEQPTTLENSEEQETTQETPRPHNRGKNLKRKDSEEVVAAPAPAPGTRKNYELENKNIF